MTTLLGLAICFAGIALILRFRDLARQIAAAALAIIAGAVALSCFRCWLVDVWESASITPDFGWFWPLAALLIMATGGIAWKTRAARQRHLADRRRRHMNPRRPAPLPPPNASQEYDEDIV